MTEQAKRECIITKTAKIFARIGAVAALGIISLGIVSLSGTAFAAGNDGTTYYEMVPHNILPDTIQYHPISRMSAEMDPLGFGAGSFVGHNPYVASYTAYPSYTVPQPIEFRPIEQALYPVFPDPFAFAPMPATVQYQPIPMYSQYPVVPNYQPIQIQQPVQPTNPPVKESAPQTEAGSPIRLAQYQVPITQPQMAAYQQPYQQYQMPYQAYQPYQQPYQQQYYQPGYQVPRYQYVQQYRPVAMVPQAQAMQMYQQSGGQYVPQSQQTNPAALPPLITQTPGQAYQVKQDGNSYLIESNGEDGSGPTPMLRLNVIDPNASEQQPTQSQLSSASSELQQQLYQVQLQIQQMQQLIQAQQSQMQAFFYQQSRMQQMMYSFQQQMMMQQSMGMGMMGGYQQPQIVIMSVPNEQPKRTGPFGGFFARLFGKKDSGSNNASMQYQQMLANQWGQPYATPSTMMRMPSANAYPYGYFGAQVAPQSSANFGGYYNMYRGYTMYPGN